VARAMAEELGLPSNIINLDVEKQRIRELLETGYQGIPRRIGQRQPSFLVQPSTGRIANAPPPTTRDVRAPSESHTQPTLSTNPLAAPPAPKVHVTDEMVAEEMRDSTSCFTFTTRPVLFFN
jgi:hypothetical protein